MGMQFNFFSCQEEEEDRNGREHRFGEVHADSSLNEKLYLELTEKLDVEAVPRHLHHNHANPTCRTRHVVRLCTRRLHHHRSPRPLPSHSVEEKKTQKGGINPTLTYLDQMARRALSGGHRWSIGNHCRHGGVQLLGWMRTKEVWKRFRMKCSNLVFKIITLIWVCGKRLLVSVGNYLGFGTWISQ